MFTSDNEMLHRLSSDSFSETALYHDACITKYLLRKPSKVAEDASESTEHESAFTAFITDIKDDLFVHKKVFLLSNLLAKFCSFLPDNSKNAYTTQHLRQRLERYFGNTITIQSQRGQGMSSLVYSSSVSLSEAIDTVNHLRTESYFHLFDLANNSESCPNERQILHAAASILRKHMRETNFPNERYPSSAEMSLDYSLEYVPPLLKDFVMWFLDLDAYETYDVEFSESREKTRKCLALAECILSINQGSFSPFHLGLALQMHHMFGSRLLVETLHSHGFCASYTEVRRFLTSASEHEVTKIKDGTYLPYGIVPCSGQSTLIQEGADNVDINAETVDGKDTFHSMARAVFQVRSSSDVPRTPGIKRLGERTVQVSETVSEIISCLPFNKPKERKEPARFSNATIQVFSPVSKNAEVSDVIWVLLRLLSRNKAHLPSLVSQPITEHQTIPFWTGYHKEWSFANSDFHVVAYPPIVDSKPTDMATVYTTMKRCREKCQTAGQHYSIQTFDQQLYAIAQQIKWSNMSEFGNHILRLGGFHALSCFISCIGKLWSDGGLSDLLIDSGTYAPCTVEQMFLGKQFNRAVRSLTLAYEALKSLWLMAFFDWCDTEGHLSNLPEEVWETLLSCHLHFRDNDHFVEVSSSFSSLFEIHIVPLMEEYRKAGIAASATFQYWDMFLQAVEILLQNIRAERYGDWNLHLISMKAMIPYFFVANRNNYARWTPVYVLDMLNIPMEVKSSFDTGVFAIRQKAGSFNGIWADMATEKTIIRDSKGHGGIKGITTQKTALIRWNLTRHIVGQISAEMRLRAGLGRDDEDVHDESKPTAIARDDKQVSNLISHIEENMIHPFDMTEPPKSLVNISTGLCATPDVENSLLHSLETGTSLARKFVESTLSENMSGNFYGAIPRSGIKTFSEMHKKTKLKCNSGVTVKSVVNPELIFRRALTLTKCRDDVTVEKLMSFPIGPIPTSLFHDDGTMRKNVKSDLARELENEATSSFFLPFFDPESTVVIRDAMGVIQSMDIKVSSSFGDFGRNYLKLLSLQFGMTATVIDVFDRYDVEDSTKSAERQRRAFLSGGHKVYKVNEGSLIPDWKKFLSNGKNKQSLIVFLGDFILDSFVSQQIVQSGNTFYLVGAFRNPECVKKMVGSEVFECHSLSSTHEEADTRIILQTLHADSEFGSRNVKGRIVIRCSDTDVLVLCIHYFGRLKHTNELWLYIGSVVKGRDSRRYIPVHELSRAFSDIFCCILPAVHALTGCDTTSAFYGVGKKSVYKLAKESSKNLESLQNFAELETDRAVESARKLVSLLYDPKEKFKICHFNLNKLRVKLATTKDSALVRLPPCESSFKQHVLRASFQAKTWMKSHVAKPSHGSPLEYGWKKGHAGLEPVLFTGMMSSDFLEDLICSCKGKSVCTNACICSEQYLACT
ncbi:hypothetical protein FSP39_006444 [Pinctada imbricata]|uniref:Uncharacterized protein n=1 Tax=Pinctada imbricata TaxID=66713 RepID=A0AA88XHW3_PINIB|nr:hypothetical protein FSP39_006444 [Pinctada imbricata]